MNRFGREHMVFRVPRKGPHAKAPSIKLLAEGKEIDTRTPAGSLVVHKRSTGLKIACVVGLAQDGRRVRVRFWRAASRKWTLPEAISGEYLRTLTSEEAQQRVGVIANAIAAAEAFGRELGSFVLEAQS